MTALSFFSYVGNIFSTAWPYVVAVLLFLVMIFIHEFGHFISAKLNKVKVNEFAIGFGPAIFKRKGKETLYAVRAIPFGGFCAMEGEDQDSNDGSAFCNKPAWRRFIIIISGAFMNLLLGLILVMITLIPADRYITTTVHSFHENSVSEQSGLEIGDKILSVNGRRIFSVNDLSYCLSNVENDYLDMTVERDGKSIDTRVSFATEEIEGINYVDVDFYLDTEDKTMGTFLKQSFFRTVSYGRVVWFSLIDLITGKFGISAVSGPVGVTEALGTAARMGIWDLLPMIALITINLGIFNLLPIPALDGGRAFFLIVEMIIRRPIPKKFEAAVHTAGLIILLGIMALVTVKDIWGLF